MSDYTEDPMVGYLRERLATLETEIAERVAQRVEIERALTVATDGRTRIAKRRKATSAPPATQPGPYDDDVSIDQVKGILA